MPQVNKRDKFTLTEEEYKQIVYQESDDYLLIEDSIIYYDGEKGSADVRIIVKRESDGRFFESIYSKWPAGGRDYSDCKFEEVFVRKVNRQVYE